jgi:hypothetical protein
MLVLPADDPPHGARTRDLRRDRPVQAKRRSATNASKQAHLQALSGRRSTRLRLVEPIVQSTFGPRMGHGNVVKLDDEDVSRGPVYRTAPLDGRAAYAVPEPAPRLRNAKAAPFGSRIARLGNSEPERRFRASGARGPLLAERCLSL